MAADPKLDGIKALADEIKRRTIGMPAPGLFLHDEILRTGTKSRWFGEPPGGR